MTNTFEDLTVAALVQVADDFAVELDVLKKSDAGNYNKSEVIGALAAFGVDWKMYQASLPPVEEEEQLEVVPIVTEEVVVTTTTTTFEAPIQTSPEVVLLKMTRRNPSYEIRGYNFTSAHPFALVQSADADYLIEEIGGFQIASPKDARSYYDA